ncbi:hypothetical protein VOLCADRAFT_92425 [Volvox carteri f. nagariensis]|uniref:Secreted protein n=1 Tax=Volvox carteri f. nagariensis TaxID=3068 RepID=D8TZM4_VOLCA|nr:uncharacterized protein VOLCADRAFT_92425 [Volvox carteri f. nagariensis]EFJ47039.1 hypothetical protein VOLCADRAFT_92425 [Volvox carteri f. nagariensis]|eukprot:XP_002951934.1 hypothetical protein VOLCADRAFT_92425 [Volvox carteri f. nagariensis]
MHAVCAQLCRLALLRFDGLAWVWVLVHYDITAAHPTRCRLVMEAGPSPHFGTHALQSWGVTAAVDNGGADRSLWCRSWPAGRVRGHYVTDSTAAQLGCLLPSRAGGWWLSYYNATRQG